VENEVLETYGRGAISFTDACRRLQIDPWELLDRLKRRNLQINVSLEDWLDSRSSL